MVMKRGLALIPVLLLAACSGPSVAAATDVLDVDGLAFRRVSPRSYGRPGADFYLLETEVTNGMYLKYLLETGRVKDEERSFKGESPEMKKRREEGWSSTVDSAFDSKNESLRWKDNRPPKGAEEYPVALLTLNDALAYCKWLTERHPERGVFRIPTVDEWMTAAYGAGRPQPWGHQPWTSRAQIQAEAPEPVRSRPEGRSPEGIYGLWGNVSEFVFHPEEVQDSFFMGVGARWMGGSFRDPLPEPGQSYWGYWHNAEGKSERIGFRVLLDLTPRVYRASHPTPADRERR